MSVRKKSARKKLSEAEIDKFVIAQADDQSAWEEPIYVRKDKPVSSSPINLAALKARRSIFWESYREIYTNYLMAISQIEILTLVGRESTKDFPKNLPEELRSPLAQ